jgi:hypothetical protein
MSDPITALVVASVTATGASVVASEKSRSQTKKANKIQEKVRQTQDARSRVAQVRQARMAQAQVVQGGASGIGTNANNNIQFINQVDSFQQAINKRMEKANTYSGIASASAGIASIAGSFAGSMEKEGDA